MVNLQDVLNFVRDPRMAASDREQIVAALNAQGREKNERAKLGLYPGLRVKWTSRRALGTEVFGVVQKVNRTTVRVKDTFGRVWRVSPALLTRA